MPLPGPRTTLRVLLGPLAAAVAALGMLPGPSYAVQGGPTAEAPTTAVPAVSGLPRLEDDAIETLRRVVTAKARLAKAVESATLRERRVEGLSRVADTASARAARLHDVADESGLLDALTSFVTGSTTPMDRAVAAVEDERHALNLLAIAQQAHAGALADLRVAEKELAAGRAAAAEVRSRAAALRAARIAIRQSRPGPGYRPASPRQRRLDRQALRSWESYLLDVARAGIVPPDAEAVADPDTLVEPFEPVHDRRGRAVPGVAETDTPDGTLTVLSAEAVRAVSATLSTLGRPDAGDTTGGPAYTCGGLASRAWAPTGLGVPDTAETQWDTLGSVPSGAVEPGDLLFTAARGDAPSSVDVVVGDGLVVAADATTGVPAVRRVGSHGAPLLGARRPGLAAADGLRVAPTSTPRCTDTAAVGEVPSTTAGRGWTLPVPAGVAPTTAFGVAGPLWSSGSHTGLDFAAPVGTPVYAARGGVVTVERPEWAGLLVRVDHGDGLETWYAHLSAVDVVPGQRVAAGEGIGAVGSAGNSTGPHLHLEVRLDGTPFDPASVLGLVATTGDPERGLA